jgi:hypothetical protein
MVEAGAGRDTASRRAAAFLLRYVVAVLRADLLFLDGASSSSSPAWGGYDAVLGGGVGGTTGMGDTDPRLAVVHRVYRLLKHAEGDSDPVVRFQAGGGLGSIAGLVRDQFANAFEKEEAPHIRIL